MLRILLVLFFIGGLSAAEKLLIPIDPQQYKQVSDTMLQAARDSDYAAVLIDGRHALELAPNDPELQAPIYLLMSFAARNSGELARANDYAALARTLDPSIESRMNAMGDNSVTRGDTQATITTGINAASQAFSAFTQIKLMKLCLDMVKHGMAPPPQCSGSPAPIAGMPQPIPGQPFPPQPISTFPMQPPPQPIPQPIGQPIGQPMPIMQPAPGQPMPMPMQLDVNGMPIQSGANVMYPPAPVGSPIYQPPIAPPTSVPGWPAPPSQPSPASNPPIPYPQPSVTGAPVPPGGFAGPGANPNPGAYPSPTRGSYSFAAPNVQAPYANARYAPRGGRVRGESNEPIFKVIHDHSNIGNQTYFAQSCGGLLSVSGANLTFTGSGGEEPRVIPASDILEIRLNSVIGKDAGVFHIATRQGLYLSLAPESQDREQARSLIETIRASLSLVE